MRQATTGCSASASPMAASQPSPGTSSASQKATAGARAAAMPMFIACCGPGRAEASTARVTISGCARPKASKIATEASVDPLSARMISHGLSHRCPARPSSVSPRVAAPFRQAMTTLSAAVSAARARPSSSRAVPSGACLPKVSRKRARRSEKPLRLSSRKLNGTASGRCRACESALMALLLGSQVSHHPAPAPAGARQGPGISMRRIAGRKADSLGEMRRRLANGVA